MAPGGFKERKATALAVPPAGSGVTTRGRKRKAPSVLSRVGPSDESASNCDKHSNPLHAGKFLWRHSLYFMFAHVKLYRILTITLFLGDDLEEQNIHVANGGEGRA